MNTISKPSVDLHREEEPHLARNLSNRHLQLIAIGGTIGTGLFMGSGKAVSLAGPSILLIYAITGFMLFFVMRALGEILLSNLQYRSFADFAGDYLGPCAQFFTGWTYWLCWIVTAVAEVVAVSGYVSFWFPHLAPWIPALGLITILLILNLPTVRNFGEIEFWFALIKIITIIGLIITGIYMLMTGFVLPNGTQASIAHLWNHGGFFPNGSLGFIAGFQISVFAFVGIELVGTAAAEAENPMRNLPKAINNIPIRIVSFLYWRAVCHHHRHSVESGGPEFKPLRGHVLARRYRHSSPFHKFCRSDFGIVEFKFRHLLDLAHGLRPCHCRACTESLQ